MLTTTLYTDKAQAPTRTHRDSFARPALAVLLVMFLLTTVGSLAQGSGEINGTVFGERGKNATNVTVTAINQQTGEVRRASINDGNHYRFDLLSTAGTWNIYASGLSTWSLKGEGSLSGLGEGMLGADTETVAEMDPDEWGTDTVRGIVLRAGERQSVSLFLKSKSEEVTITASRVPLINTRDAEVSAYISEAQIASIPTDGRKVSNQLYFLPGATPATGYFPEAPNVSINGQNSLYTNYLIDGFDNNEQFLGGMKFDVPIGIAQNVAVLTNSYSAEYGRTANGIINVTTKSGTNDLSGEVFYTVRPGSVIDAHNAFAPKDPDGEFVDEGFTRHQVGFSLGGPIAKDKTFFFLNAEITRDRLDYIVNTPIVSDISTGNNASSLFTAKIDHRWNESHQTSLRGNVGIVTLDFPGSGAVMDDAGRFQDRDAALLALKHTAFLSPKSLNETRLQYSSFDWNYARPHNTEGLPQVTLYDTTGALLGIVGHPGYAFDATERTWQFANTYIHHFDNHTVKGGFDILSADHTLLGGGPPNGAYTAVLTDVSALKNDGKIFGYNDLPSDPGLYNVLSYTVESRPEEFGLRQNIVSLFVEDSYKVSSYLTLNLGVRWDFDNLSKAGGDHYDLNNIAPRTSFNLSLDKEGTKAVRGGYGIFYEKLVYSIASDAMQFSTRRPVFLQQLEELKTLGILPADASIGQMTFNGNASITYTGNDSPNFGEGAGATNVLDSLNGLPATELRIINPNGLQNPYSHQISLGYQQQFGDDIALSVDGVLLFGENLVRLRDLNAPTPYESSGAAATESPRSIADADATRPVGARQGGARQITVSETGGRSRYQAVIVNLRKRLREDFGFSLSYTLSWNKNNSDDINFRAMDANNFEQEYSWAVNDRRHVLALTGSYKLPFDGTVSLNTLFQSGQPINRTVGLSNAEDIGNFYGHGSQFGDGYAGNLDRYPGVERNGERLPSSFLVDLGISYPITFSNITVELRADVFNLFNTVNHSGYFANATETNRAQVGRPGDPIVYRSAGPPRQFQFSTHVKF